MNMKKFLLLILGLLMLFLNCNFASNFKILQRVEFDRVYKRATTLCGKIFEEDIHVATLIVRNGKVYYYMSGSLKGSFEAILKSDCKTQILKTGTLLTTILKDDALDSELKRQYSSAMLLIMKMSELDKKGIMIVDREELKKYLKD